MWARDNSLSMIDARHIMLACVSDEELDSLARGAVQGERESDLGGAWG